MTKLSVNVNKIATIRNARGGNNPNLIQVVKDCERFGAEGITVHPRPDERHITYQDARVLKAIVTTEYNIEGFPSDSFMELVLTIQPDQVTLVPDPPGVLTSDAGWDTINKFDFLKEVTTKLQSKGIRVSVFTETDLAIIDGAKKAGVDRIELYTGPYADHYEEDKTVAIKEYVVAAKYANKLGLGINAGHDLSLDNLAFFAEQIPVLDEVSIGHALICDALYLGIENSIQLYLKQLECTKVYL